MFVLLTSRPGLLPSVTQSPSHNSGFLPQPGRVYTTVAEFHARVHTLRPLAVAALDNYISNMMIYTDQGPVSVYWCKPRRDIPHKRLWVHAYAPTERAESRRVVTRNYCLLQYSTFCLFRAVLPLLKVLSWLFCGINFRAIVKIKCNKIAPLSTKRHVCATILQLLQHSSHLSTQVCHIWHTTCCFTFIVPDLGYLVFSLRC